MRRADRIVVIERGAVVEEGTHDELVAIPSGRYAHAFGLQANRYSDDGVDAVDLRGDLPEGNDEHNDEQNEDER